MGADEYGRISLLSPHVIRGPHIYLVPWLRAEPVDQETWPVTTLEEIWPVFGLRVEAGPVELSAIRR
jgi:hypothetical protein